MSQDPSILIPVAGPLDPARDDVSIRPTPSKATSEGLGRTGVLDKPAPAPGASRVSSPWRALLPVGAAYAQALAIWRHRLDGRRESNLARIEAIHAASSGTR
jgi:hypothetical protein